MSGGKQRPLVEDALHGGRSAIRTSRECGVGGCRPDGSSGKVKLVTIEPRDEGAIISKIAMSERGRDGVLSPCTSGLYPPSSMLPLSSENNLTHRPHCKSSSTMTVPFSRKSSSISFVVFLYFFSLQVVVLYGCET